MRAVVLHPKGIFKIEDVAQPNLQSSQVLIKVEGFGLNFADVMARKGLYREAPPLPSILGYDVIGEVIEQGKDVPENFIGKRVVAITRFGGYAEFATTDYRAIAQIPKDYPLAEALALATQYCTAYFCLHEKANVYENDKVLIHAAAGGVGVALTQLAKLKGCKIYGTCGSDEKIDFIQKNGVDVAINYRKQNYEKTINECLHASFNAVGGNTLKKDMRLLGNGGTLICFGAANRTDKKAGFFSNLNLLFSSGFYSPLFLMMRSKSVVGVNMLKIGDYRPNLLQNTLKEVVKLAIEGKIKPHSGGVFSANDISKAHSLLENRNSMGKIAIKW
jgi:NADPH2:quinone reductase